MAKSKHIAQIVIIGLSLCVLTLASQKYTNTNENKTAVKTVIDTSQTIILPDDYENMFSFYTPAANPIANTTNNTTSDNNTEQTNTNTETDTANTSATDITAETTLSDEPQSTKSNEPTTPSEPATTSCICEKDGYIDDHWISDINTQLAMVPSNLITEFQNDG